MCDDSLKTRWSDAYGDTRYSPLPASESVASGVTRIKGWSVSLGRSRGVDAGTTLAPEQQPMLTLAANRSVSTGATPGVKRPGVSSNLLFGFSIFLGLLFVASFAGTMFYINETTPPPPAPPPPAPPPTFLSCGSAEVASGDFTSGEVGSGDAALQLCMNGLWPLYEVMCDAYRASPKDPKAVHNHTVDGTMYWMPTGYPEARHPPGDVCP